MFCLARIKVESSCAPGAGHDQVSSPGFDRCMPSALPMSHFTIPGWYHWNPCHPPSGYFRPLSVHRCPQVMGCYWREVEPFSATLAPDELAECDQPEKIPQNTPPWMGLNPGHGEDREGDSFIFPLRYHDWLGEDNAIILVECRLCLDILTSGVIPAFCLASVLKGAFKNPLKFDFTALWNSFTGSYR